VGFNYNTDSHKHTSLLKFIIDKGLNTTQQNDTQHNDTQHNDTQHNVTQHNDTQHNGLFVTLSINETWHSDTQQNTIECRYEEFGYAVSLFIVSLCGVIILSVVMLCRYAVSLF